MTFPGRRWVWYGGLPSLDFVNTRRNREAGRADEVAEYLRGPDDLTAWLSAAGPGPAACRAAASPGGDSPGRSPDEETFAAALALREAISALVTATVGGGSAPAAPFAASMPGSRSRRSGRCCTSRPGYRCWAPPRRPAPRAACSP